MLCYVCAMWMSKKEVIGGEYSEVSSCLEEAGLFQVAEPNGFSQS